MSGALFFVGVALAIALNVALAWFLLRRRKPVAARAELEPIEDTPRGHARFVYDADLRRRAPITPELARLAQQYGLEGRRAFEYALREPMPDLATLALDAPAVAIAARRIVCTPLVWKRKGFSDAWTIKLARAGDIEAYIAAQRREARQ